MSAVGLSLVDVSRRIHSGELTSRAVTDELLDRIDATCEAIGAYSFVDAEGARARATALDAEIASGRSRGPLHGVPVAVKDIFDVDGWPSEIGMPSRRGMLATGSATAVTRLLDHGAVIIGKVHTTEGVYAEHTPPFLAPRNPWNPDRWVGASSSGSAAAVSARLAYAALASDTGGSIRMPSAVTGSTGIKPTWGRVSRAGVFELAASLDHVGVIARSAVDAAMILEAMAGPDSADPTAAHEPIPHFAESGARLDGIVIGIDETWISEDVERPVSDAVRDMLNVLVGLGARLSPVRLPDARQINEDWFGICGVQAARGHRANFAEREGEYGGALADLITDGSRMTAVEYDELLQRRADFSGRMRAVLSHVDAIAMPALPFVTPPAADMVAMSSDLVARIHRFTVPFTMSGLPSVTLPVGLDPSGMPMGGQLVAGPFREETAVQIAAAYQENTDWHRLEPSPAQ
ncbi:MAG: amidase [Mycobacterium sp.]